MSESYLSEAPREAGRLAAKVDADAWVETYLAPHVAGRARILDVGCGPGTIAAAVARAFPRAGVVAVDPSAPRTEVAKTALARFRNAQAVQGDMHDLPFADDAFDLVYARFLLARVPDKERVAAELARVCRPGGMVIVQDLDGQLVDHYPPDPDLERRLALALPRLERTGFDAFVGRKLFALLRRAGLRDCEVAIECCQPIGPAARRQPAAELDAAAAALEEAGIRDAAALVDDLLAHLHRDETIAFSQLFTVWGTKAPAEEPPLLRLVRGGGGN